MCIHAKMQNRGGIHLGVIIKLAQGYFTEYTLLRSVHIKLIFRFTPMLPPTPKRKKSRVILKGNHSHTSVRFIQRVRSTRLAVSGFE